MLMSLIEVEPAAASRALRPLASLVPYVLRYKLLVGGALVALVAAAGTTLLLPMALKTMIDQGFSASNTDFINSYFSLLLILAVMLALASAFRYYFVITLGERIVADLRRDVFAHVSTLSPSFFDVNQSGEIVSRLTADTTQLKSVVGATASMALRNTILCLGAMGMMIYTSPKLSALVLAAIPLIVFPLVGFGRSVRARSRAAQDKLAAAAAFAGEAIAAARTVQAFNNEHMARDRYTDAVEAAYRAARASTRSRAWLTGFAITLVFGSVVGVLWYGAQNVMNGTMTAGTLGQFLLYSVMAASSLGALSEVWGEISQASGSAGRLVELLAERPKIRAPDHPLAMPVPTIGSLAFDKVQFTYPTRTDQRALSGMSFAVRPGETVAIVGPSGAGKSTIFAMILRYYDPEQGTISVDGIDIAKVAPKDLRDRLAIVPQDVTIFATTIHDNIAFGKVGASRAEVEAAARAAQADEFISRLEKGYDTEVGERGIMLSGGQRQRIAIARAILKDAPILLLDEATSALDAESETLVQKALDGLMVDRTTIIIAHRLATVLKADRILVVDRGRIVEEGTHQSLVAEGGIYARLARLQFDSHQGSDLAAAL